MFLPIADLAPRDLTPKDARARTYLAGANPLAAQNVLARLDKHLLHSGDAEVRVWGGFAWGTRGIVLSRKGQIWTAVSVTLSQSKRPHRLPPPKSGWPDFIAHTEALGLWTLPDQAQIQDKKGYAEIFDGYSTLVETQKDGEYRAYGYNNPGNQVNWSPAKPAIALDRYVFGQFSSPKAGRTVHGPAQ